MDGVIDVTHGRAALVTISPAGCVESVKVDGKAVFSSEEIRDILSRLHCAERLSDDGTGNCLALIDSL